MDAVVSLALPNAMFEVEVEGGHKLIAYAAGRMRRYFIRITPGDRIRVELSPYDLTRGRILYRYSDRPPTASNQSTRPASSASSSVATPARRRLRRRNHAATGAYSATT